MSNKQAGCFVYRVIDAEYPIVVRSAPSWDDAYKTKIQAKNGNLVSIDCIIQVDHDNNNNKGGPKFLRLADGSGWLFDRAFSSNGNGPVIMEPVPVESGLWCFYVDNNPVGILLRNHPIDDCASTDLNNFVLPGITLPPQQKIYCDRKVIDGSTTFYRIQGSISSWVFDKRGARFMLVPEHSIACGLFAYQITSNDGVAMRDQPDVGEEAKIPNCIADVGNLVVGDYLRQSPHGESNGPFLRLTNGMGWLFGYKYCQQVMREVLIGTGLWYWKVVNRIQLRKQPIDLFQYRFPTEYPPGAILTCDRQIIGANGVKFYRVKGTTGWVFDRRDDYSMLTPCSAPNGNSLVMMSSPPASSLPISWTIDFVRGVACAIEGIQEIGLNEESRIISFSKDGPTKTRINVYYTTRTIGTVLDHPSQGRTQLFRRDCTIGELAEIMRNPRVHTSKGYTRKRQRTSAEQAGSSIDAEEETRNKLIEVDEALETLEERRRNLVASIVEHDSKRHRLEGDASKLLNNHVQTCDNEKRLADNAREMAIRLVANAEREKASRTCQICNRVFGSVQALDNHNGAVHTHQCKFCYKQFSNPHALNQHCTATGHF
ncbi:unnamed protein product [Cylindrotheca closterium]|uniref:C2H2-type domain-containing protein n=1 Tax=Cylindrotheca closterium TaxID=2856 RepID=A0AAD2FJ44_9STRA|nr:unnamed protein product [Cylindrotheca closterium]